MNAPHGPPPPERRPPHAGPYPAAAFAPPSGLAWVRVSGRLPWHRRLTGLLAALPIAAAGAFVFSRGSAGAVGALIWALLVVVWLVASWIVAEFDYRSWGYAERRDDLVITHGVFTRRLVVVPYGRMQFVDVSAGLLERWMGIATVRLHTAAAATDARIPGLPAAEAGRLRDRLAQRGEARSVGL
jgi:uncharacterized protein